MSFIEQGYPQARYVAPGAGPSVWAFSGDRYTIKAAAGDTGGSFGVMEAIVPPQSGPPMHIHHKEDEAFYIVDGRFEIADHERELVADAGSFIWLPRGGPHRFRNISDKHAKMLLFFLPGGFEQFFVDCGTPADGGSAAPSPEQFAVDVERSMRLAADQYGIEAVPAPDI
nr:cupin domain-containing protein [Micromonospora sp. DSM 115978]